MLNKYIGFTETTRLFESSGIILKEKQYPKRYDWVYEKSEFASVLFRMYAKESYDKLLQKIIQLKYLNTHL